MGKHVNSDGVEVEEENHHGTWVFMYAMRILNAVQAIMGLALVGAGIFLEYGYDDTATSLVKFPLHVLAYVLGVVALVLAVLGVVGDRLRLWWMLAIYFQLILLVLLLEVGLSILAALYAPNMSEFVLAGWNVAGDSVKNDIQKSLQCCGFENAADGSAGSVCPEGVTLGCGVVVRDEIYKRVNLGVGVGVTAAVFQLFAIISSALVMYRMPKHGELHTDSFWSDALNASDVTTEESTQ